MELLMRLIYKKRTNLKELVSPFSFDPSYNLANEVVASEQNTNKMLNHLMIILSSGWLSANQV